MKEPVSIPKTMLQDLDNHIEGMLAKIQDNRLESAKLLREAETLEWAVRGLRSVRNGWCRQIAEIKEAP